jgi:hypothetical protein
MEFVRQAGTQNLQGPVDEKWRKGLEEYWNEYYSQAKDTFRDVAGLFPEHSEAQKLEAECLEKIAQGKDKTPPPPPPAESPATGTTAGTAGTGGSPTATPEPGKTTGPKKGPDAAKAGAEEGFPTWAIAAIAGGGALLVIVVILIIVLSGKKKPAAVPPPGMQPGPYGVPGAAPPPGYGAPPLGAPQMGAPQMGAPPGVPQMGMPLGVPQMGMPLGAPQMGMPLGAPQMGAPPGAPSRTPMAGPLPAPAPIPGPMPAGIAPTLATPAPATPGIVAKTEMYQAPSTTARLSCTVGPLQGRELPIGNGFFIGRDPARAQVLVQDGQVSGQHMWIGPAAGRIVVRDMGSTNGTYLNNRLDQRITEVALNEGDVLVLGQRGTVQFVFHL